MNAQNRRCHDRPVKTYYGERKEFLGYSVDEVAQAYVKLSPAIKLPKHVQNEKGPLAKTTALQVRHDFWYISPTFSVRLKSSELYFLCES